MKSQEKGRTLLGKGGLLTVAALAIACVVHVPGAAGAVAAVTTTTDGGPGSLRQAIAEAQAGDTIAVPAGTYVLSRGELEIDKALTIAGAGAGSTTIDANDKSRVFRVSTSLNTPVTISGLRITGGKGEEVPELQTFSGAAIVSLNADLTLREDVIAGNVTKAPAERAIFGGAVEVNRGRFTMIGTTVTDNTAAVSGIGSSEFGGIVFGAGVGVELVDLARVEDSQVNANVGQVSVDAPGNLVIGGGMRLLANGTALVSGSTFRDNIARVDSGSAVAGGLLAEGRAKTVLNGDTLVGNLADAGSGSAEAGGLFGTGGTDVFNTTLESNRVRGDAFASGGNYFGVQGDATFSRTAVLHGIGPAGSENCGFAGGAIRSEGFNRESTDQCGFDAEGDEVNVG
jgi:hypothetical protein